MPDLGSLNNPGALRLSGSTEFQRFNSPEEGIRAQEALLGRYYDRGRKTIRTIIEHYAPRKRNGGDNTDEQVDNYIHYVATRAGVNPDDTLGKPVLTKIGSAMREFETGKTKKVGPAPKSNGGNTDMTQAAADAFGTPLKNYTVGQPGPNEGSVQSPAPQVDESRLQSKASEVVTTSDMYSQFLKDAVNPLLQNAQQQIERQQAIVGVKRNIVNDFATREADLESKIKPLMAQREEIAQKLLRVDAMSPLEQRFKAIFNPREYDPRLLRGRQERIDSAINIYEGNYDDLNKLRAGVAASSIDAETADMSLLQLGAASTELQSRLIGQVAQTVKQNATDQLFPLSTHVETMRLSEYAKASLLGKLTLERTVSLYQQAQASPDGTVTVDGVKLTVGELQGAAKVAQQQDLTFRSMINAYKTSDLQTTDALESNYIDHMTPEQANEALKNGGKITGANGQEYQLSITKLTAAVAAGTQLRDQKVDQVINSTAAGQAASFLKNLTQQGKLTQARAQEMFGTVPGELTQFFAQETSAYSAWRQGADKIVGDPEAYAAYVAKTMPTLAAMQDGLDRTINTIADKWGGGKKELAAVANNYLRGNPISGDAALKGLVIIARSGMPAGSKISGPAAQALQVARATVQEWDNPQSGDSLDSLLKGGNKKEADLLRLIQTRVGAVYADGVADSIITDLPQLARSVRDPNNPNRLHPFARISRDDFIMAVRHGDASAYEIVGNKMGVDANKAKRIFSSGPDSTEWQEVAKSKGYSKNSFAEFYSALQSLQMSETLAALDASHSAAPGFSPSKAYVDFLQTPEVANRVNQAVQNYGNSSFGSYLISSSAGGGFKDAWDGYTQSLNAAYMQLHSKELKQRITQQRSIAGDPWVRVNAVNRAAGLQPQESQYLLNAVKPLVHMPAEVGGPMIDLSESGAMASTTTNASSQFDAIANVIRNRPLEDPQAERLRKKVASQWEAMDAMVGTIFDSVNE